MTKVLTCECKHIGQDEMYGKDHRVFNSAIGTGGKTVWRCTVCGKEVDRRGE